MKEREDRVAEKAGEKKMMGNWEGEEMDEKGTIVRELAGGETGNVVMTG